MWRMSLLGLRGVRLLHRVGGFVPEMRDCCAGGKGGIFGSRISVLLLFWSFWICSFCFVFGLIWVASSPSHPLILVALTLRGTGCWIPPMLGLPASIALFVSSSLVLIIFNVAHEPLDTCQHGLFVLWSVCR